MDSLEKWHAHIADIRTLLQHCEAEQAAGRGHRTRVREIFTICMFTLCLENNENKRFLIGFQQRGRPPASGGPVRDLFIDGFGEIENVDVILIPDLGADGPTERDIHRCQLVGYRDVIDQELGRDTPDGPPTKYQLRLLRQLGGRPYGSQLTRRGVAADIRVAREMRPCSG